MSLWSILHGRDIEFVPICLEGIQPLRSEKLFFFRSKNGNKQFEGQE